MAGDERQELAAIAADLRAHLSWLGECGARELPRPAAPPPAEPSMAQAGQAAVAGPSVKGASLLEMVRAKVGAAGGRPSAGSSGTPIGAVVPPVVPGPPASIPPPPVRQPVAASPVALTERGARPAAAGPSLEAVRAELGDCRRCRLAGCRGRLAFGGGPSRARLVFIGEAPWAEEDAGGGAFAGAAGELLGKMVEAMGFARGEVYVTNLVKCRPPEDRKPQRDELDACEPFLKAQLAALRPEVIVALGKFASQRLLRDASPITELRGRWREYCGIRLMPTFHPAYLLRSPREKAKVWEDLQQVMKELARAPAERG